MLNSSGPIKYIKRAPSVRISPCHNICQRPFLLKMRSLSLLAFLSIIFGSAGLMPSARAGSPSVMRFIHSICTGRSGMYARVGSTPRRRKIKLPKTIAINMSNTSEILHESKKRMNFFRLSYITRPSLMAFTIVAKLSSVSIISLASLLTSVPVMPIARPISAFFREGASLIPSPVIATIWSFFFNASTIATLCSGDTLAKTFIFSISVASSSSEIFENSSSSTILSLSPSIPSSSPIALAVSLWSPVTMIMFIFACLHRATAS